MRQIARRYPFSTAFTALIWLICLVPIGQTPLGDVYLGDKWAHMIMYLLLSVVIAVEYTKRNKCFSLSHFLFAILAFPIITGGLIELAQAYLTFGNRSGEWLDWFSDCLGSLAASIICTPLAKCHAREKKDA